MPNISKIQLPNGTELTISTLVQTNGAPTVQGETNKLYVDKNADKIYYYDGSKFKLLNEVTYAQTAEEVTGVKEWHANTPTTVEKDNSKPLVKFTNGSAAQLITKESINAVTSITLQNGNPDTAGKLLTPLTTDEIDNAWKGGE